MRKLTISLAAVALVGFAAASAQAQCDFNGPGKAKGIKSSLIRSFAGCPSITFAGPNSQTGGGTPTCAPPYAHSPHFFDEVKGKCDFQAKAKKEDPCSDGSGVPWVTQDGTTGLVVTPGSPVVLAAALRHLLADTVLAERLGRAGRARFEAQFQAGTMIDRIAMVYRGLGPVSQRKHS